ncbi:hypothetical protein EVA_09196 [gut metagenome]|uniref:Uncharacterized protein n=1 Tax=gut metagenome TaxID=749906 RepID=J9CRA5_9ZZZZ
MDSPLPFEPDHIRGCPADAGFWPVYSVQPADLPDACPALQDPTPFFWRCP